MKYLVTGGSGFIGTHLVNYLKGKGEVIILDREYPSFIDIANCKNNNKIIDTLEGVDCVFHLAAETSVPRSIENPLCYNYNNVDGTVNILTLCKEAGVRRLVFSSSASVYGGVTKIPLCEDDPAIALSPYGLQKLIGEQYCELYSKIYDIETVSLRYFNVFGEGMPTTGSYCSLIGSFMKRLADQKPLQIYGDGTQSRDFIYIKDVVTANWAASQSDDVGRGESINIGTAEATTVNEIADVFKLPRDFLPKRLEPSVSICDNTKAKNLLNWEPSVKVVDWLNENIHSRT
jgi:UDP-glucose 4-epimerase